MRKTFAANTAATAFDGFRLGRLFGIELVADFSLVLVFILIASQLGWGVFPRWHPDWSAGLVWLVAISAALLLFVSITLHELSHALVARRYQMPVRRTPSSFSAASRSSNESRAHPRQIPDGSRRPGGQRCHRLRQLAGR